MGIPKSTGSEKQLRLDLQEKGMTPFQIEVLIETSRIPRGTTRSYSEIASLIGRPGTARAVGSALRKNPFPGERVPCHRVIQKSGNPTGFLGSTDPDSKENQKKCKLLKSEGAFFKS